MDKTELKLKLKQFGSSFKDSAGKFTRSAMENSKKMAEKVKIQNKIRKAEKKRKETYIAIGQKYQELYASQADPEFLPFLDALAEEEAIISAAYTELSALDNAVICQNCGKYISETQKFCPYCGAKSETSSTVEAEVLSTEIVESETDIKSEPETDETFSSID
ncbi:MAG: zinc ribbon domain-containing protein [Oscillospiraceae bacterium]|nr:zinc ribbon domain-containing protein [Oscillospiraceae bacterium]